ncbi:MAG TPA: hypothetical protein VG737_09330, partial [Cyclobacteriaceae bacterium]|nr:hypothetical protein [Cyclobacteriaceae bacterium]
MKSLAILLISSAPLISSSIRAQPQQREIKDKITLSDSILIVSHDQYWLHSTPGKPAIRRNLVINNHPNGEIVKQQSRIDLQSRHALLALFKKMKRDSLFEPAFCFDPHQAVIFF